MPESSQKKNTQRPPHTPRGEDDLIYDPDQDTGARRELRQNYRKDIDDLSGNPDDVQVEKLLDAVTRTNETFREKVKAPQEATLDATFMRKVIDITQHKARGLKSDAGGFDVDDFVSRLITFMGGRKHMEADDDSDDDDDDGMAPLDWDKIGRKALAKSRRVPAMDFMLGPLAIEQKKRAQVKRAKLEKEIAEERRPQELKEEDIQRSENETTKNVLVLEKILEAQQAKVNLFKFIINPNDFAQSVENMFYLSFLIRDAKCALEIDPDTCEPLIYLCDPPTNEDYENGASKKQIVMELDMAAWKRAIEVFNITEPTIPQRAVSKYTGDKWVG